MARGATRKRQRAAKRQVLQGWGRLLRRLAGACLLVGLLGLLALGGRALLSLPIERVVVTGDLKHVDREALKSMINVSLEGGFLWQDLQSMREPLEALPWVHRVVVRRQWPDSIEVRVVEQRPIARWGDRALLNHAGEVFEPASLEQVPALPRLAGPEGAHSLMMQRYLQVQQSLQRPGLKVVALEMDARGAVVATLADGSELLFGRGALAEKLDRFNILYARRLAGKGELPARVDLRYSHGAAVAWRGERARPSAEQET